MHFVVSLLGTAVAFSCSLNEFVEHGGREEVVVGEGRGLLPLLGLPELLLVVLVLMETLLKVRGYIFNILTAMGAKFLGGSLALVGV